MIDEFANFLMVYHKVQLNMINLVKDLDVNSLISLFKLRNVENIVNKKKSLSGIKLKAPHSYQMLPGWRVQFRWRDQQ